MKNQQKKLLKQLKILLRRCASIGLPEIILKKKINKGVNILDLIANNKILSSKSEARRVILNKGFKLNDKVIDDEKKILQLKDFEKNTLKLSYGKKKHYIIKIN